MFQPTDAGVELFRLMDTRPDRLALLVLHIVCGLFLSERGHTLLKSDGQIGPGVEQQGQHRDYRQKRRVALIELEQNAVLKLHQQPGNHLPKQNPRCWHQGEIAQLPPMERHFMLSNLKLEGIEHDGQHGGMG